MKHFLLISILLAATYSNANQCIYFFDPIIVKSPPTWKASDNSFSVTIRGADFIKNALLRKPIEMSPLRFNDPGHISMLVREGAPLASVSLMSFRYDSFSQVFDLTTLEPTFYFRGNGFSIAMRMSSLGDKILNIEIVETNNENKQTKHTYSEVIRAVSDLKMNLTPIEGADAKSVYELLSRELGPSVFKSEYYLYGMSVVEENGNYKIDFSGVLTWTHRQKLILYLKQLGLSPNHPVLKQLEASFKDDLGR